MMKDRNYSIDILKFVCAVLVVILHTGFNFHDEILPITRCAVPCFFMISGFLLYSDNKGIGNDRLKRNIKHIFHVIIWSTLLFALIKECMAIRHGGLFFPSMREWFNFIVFNDNPFGFHLWYLNAYLYVLLIMVFVDKYKLWKPFLWVTPLLLLGDLFFGKYSLLLLNHEYPFVYVRNFLFVGLPYFMIGIWIKINNKSLLNMNKLIYMGGVICFTCTSVLEKMILLKIGKSPMREHYLSTTFLAVCLFLFAISFQKNKSSRVSLLGEKDSLYIYVFHPLFIMILPMVIKKMPKVIGLSYQFTAPFVVLVLTIILTMILRKINLIK